MNEVAAKHILEGLNEKQAAAVRATSGPVLILAGAGSGKTRALTHRIAYLIASGVRAESILAVTFTNKAATEMKLRVAKLLQGGVMPNMGTFHSICLRILRIEIEKLGAYSRNFVMYDTADQETLIKRVMLDLAIDPKKNNPKSMLHRISELKSELLGAQSFESEAKEYRDKILAGIYTAYQSALEQANALDFDDLIMLCVRLFREHPAVLEKYQDHFQYILIDEYQDTNHAQYAWANLLAKKYRNIAVVGDDAQSIYGWRKADIRNILDFEKDYPDATVVTMDQNYRSTQNILDAANSIIGNNTHQKQKHLWTDNDRGERIIVKEAHNAQDEGIYIVDTIREKARKQKGLGGFTVLYRTHAQSRALEETLIRHGMPYRILGGVKFYERREIKDILAYLRVISNPRDLVSFERIYNVPQRGLGEVSYKKWKSDPETLGKKQLAAFKSLEHMFDELRTEAKKLPLSKLMGLVFKKIGYESFLDDKTEEGQARWENVKELLTVTHKYDELPPPEGLEKFLEEATLMQETDQLVDGEQVVTMMTMHSAKGLEFPVVFIIGMEDGIFPHARSLFDPTQLEEERRLCYVGVTRAREELHLLFCRQRTLYGMTQINPPSRFVLEIPENLVDFIPA